MSLARYSAASRKGWRTRKRMARWRQARAQERREWIADRTDGEALLAEGFDDAILGVAERAGQPPLVLYDAQLCIEIQMKRSGVTDYAQARDAFELNTMGAWLGEHTPLFLWRPEDE